MRNPKLVGLYGLIIASVCALSFPVSDLSREFLGVSLDLPVATRTYATGWHGNSFWQNFWNNFWNNYQNYQNNYGTNGWNGFHTHRVPEPSSLVLFGLGMAGVHVCRRRSRERAQP